MKRKILLPSKKYKTGDYFKKNGVVIGVMISDSQYVSLSDQASSYVSWSSAISLQFSYSIQGITGWNIPTKDEWAIMYTNKSIINTTLRSAGSILADDWYWTSTYGGQGYYSCEFGSGGYWHPGSENRVRLIHKI